MAHEIKSPIPGIFYRKPSPEADPFVEVGDSVEPETVVGLVEVMKTFHQVVADVSGTIVGIEVDDAVVVDAGQTLITVDAEGTSQ